MTDLEFLCTFPFLYLSDSHSIFAFQATNNQYQSISENIMRDSTHRKCKNLHDELIKSQEKEKSMSTHGLE